VDITIIIVSFNTQELLHDCLSSIKTASKNLSVETFVVDNNSIDNTAQMVTKFFPKVNLIVNDQNLGFSKANNQAIKKAKGTYVLVLNPDTKLMPNTLVEMFNFMQKRDDVGIATCKVELTDGTLDKDCKRSFPTPFRALCHFSGISKIFSGSKIFDQYHLGYLNESKTYEIDSCVGAFMFIRNSALKKVGPFDEKFFFYGEDLDLCWRFWQKSYKVMYYPMVKIIHYKGASSGVKRSSEEFTKATKESKERVLKESIRAMQIFYKKHYVEQYPFFVNAIVSLSLLFIRQVRLFTYKV